MTGEFQGIGEAGLGLGLCVLLPGMECRVLWLRTGTIGWLELELKVI